MSRKNNVPETAGIDKLESFLQTYFKQLIIGVGVLIGAFIAVYAINGIRQSSMAKKANLVGEAQVGLVMPTAEKIKSFQELTAVAPFLKNYIDLVSGAEWVRIGNNEAALKILPQVTGDFKDMASGFAYDLGDKNIQINQYLVTSSMQPVWYYRLVLESKPEDRAKNLELFKSKFPESKLLTLLENWTE